MLGLQITTALQGDSCGFQIKRNKCLYLSYQIQSKNRWGKKTFCTQHFTGDFIQLALSLAALLICTLAVWQSSICSRRINTSGADGSPYRYYVTHAKSISADRDTIHVYYAFFWCFFPFNFHCCRRTDRQEITIKPSIKRGKCCQQPKNKEWAMQEVCGVITVTVPMFSNKRNKAMTLWKAKQLTSVWLFFRQMSTSSAGLVYRLKLD